VKIDEIPETQRAVLDKRTRAGGQVVSEGDDVVWAVAHARNVARCLRIKEALQRSDYPRLRSILQWIAGDDLEGMPLSIPTLEKTHGARIQVSAPSGRRQVAAEAHRLLAVSIGPNLGGVSRVMRPEGGSAFQFQALVQLIYWQLADWISGERLGVCAECGLLFYSHDARQKFCPPPPDVRESRCGRSHRGRAPR
jgi:hypothetical protein